MDENQTKDEEVNEEVVDQTQEDAQEELQDEEQVQEDTQDEQDEEESETEQPEEEQQEEEEKQPSRREQLRINQLLNKYGNPYKREKSQAPNNDGVNYREMIQADDEVIDQLNEKTKQYGQEQFQTGYEQANKHAEYLNWHTGLKIDTPKVHADFPQMENERIRDSINQQYLAFVGYTPADPARGTKASIERPDVSFYDFVAAKDEEAREIAAVMTEQTRRNVTKQAARTGLRPDGSSAKKLDLTKNPSDMTDEELNAALKVNGLAPKKR